VRQGVVGRVRRVTFNNRVQHFDHVPAFNFPDRTFRPTRCELSVKASLDVSCAAVFGALDVGDIRLGDCGERVRTAARFLLDLSLSLDFRINTVSKELTPLACLLRALSSVIPFSYCPNARRVGFRLPG
jgi:hypothetical protein